MRNYFIALVTLSMLTACNKNQKAENPEPTLEQATEQTAENNQIAADFNAYQLRGKVKFFTVESFEALDEEGKYDEDCGFGQQKVQFDEEGHITHDELLGACTEVSTERDENGSLMYLNGHDDSESSYLIINEFHFNEKGQLEILNRSISDLDNYESNATFTYDEEGNVTKEDKTFHNEVGMQGSIHSEYKVLESDEKGNWTKRLVKSKIAQCNDPDDPASAWEDEQTTVQIRKISYR